MTDNEIIKELENRLRECEKVKYGARKLSLVNYEFLKDVLDLINRQQTEIENLKKSYEIYEESSGLKWAKSKAIKEFAERLKEKSWQGMWEIVAHVDVDDIDNLVKEMTEGNK